MGMYLVHDEIICTMGMYLVHMKLYAHYAYNSESSYSISEQKNMRRVFYCSNLYNRSSKYYSISKIVLKIYIFDTSIYLYSIISPPLP